MTIVTTMDLDFDTLDLKGPGQPGPMGPPGPAGPPGPRGPIGSLDGPADVPGLEDALAAKASIAALKTVNGASLVGAGDLRTPSAFPSSSITDMTAAGRALLTAASDAAQRSALGLGSAATASAFAFAPAAHAASTANPHAVTKAQVGLGRADDTSDAAKAAPGNPVGDAIAARYLRPAAGVPREHLAADVRTLLDKADAAAPPAPALAKGSIAVGSAALPAGPDGHALVADSSAAAGLRYAAVLSAAALSARGDLLAGSGLAGTAAARVPAGPDGFALVADSGAPAGLRYAAMVPGDVLVAKGDLLAGSGLPGTAAARVPAGPDGHALVADSAAPAGLLYAAIVSAGVLGARGDVLVASAPGVASALAVGADNQVLTAVSGAPAWRAAPGAAAMVGATPLTPGVGGLVPASNPYDHTKFLAASGAWLTGAYAAIGTWAEVRALDDARFEQGDRALVTDFGAGAGTAMVWSGAAWRFANGAARAATLGPAGSGASAIYETAVLSAAVPAGLAIRGSAFEVALYGTQTNAAAASSTTYRIRYGATAADVAGPVLAALEVQNGAAARARCNCAVTGGVTLTGSTAASGALWQGLDSAAGGVTAAAAPPATGLDLSVPWHLVVTCRNSAMATERAFVCGSVTMTR